MREEHPIDERFKALYDAEVDPPGEVRDALARHIGWDPGRTAGGLWHSWLLLGSGAALAVTSVLYMGHRDDPTTTPAAESHTLVHEATHNTAPGTPGEAVAPTSSADVASDAHTSATATPNTANTGNHTATHTTQGANRITPWHEAAAPTTGQHQPQLHTTSGAVAQPGFRAVALSHSAIADFGDGAAKVGWVATTNTTHDTPSPEPAGRDTPSAGSTHPNPAAIQAMDPLVAEDATWMQSLPLGGRTVPGGSPLHAPHPAPYVLPAAQWWLGTYAGAGRLNGEWRGPDSEALNAAERWRGSTQWGLLFGRRWRSGWSVSAGAGLGLTRSTFAHDEQQWERFMDIDTNWTQTYYNNTLDAVYIWSIDTVAVERPGTVHRTHARNVYGALQIPLTAAWHGTIRRWHYGAFGGATLWVPTQRQGSTLHRQTPDAHLRVVDLGDAATNAWSGPRLNAHAGLSFGFALSETFSVYAEPMMTMPVSTFGKAGAPWMTGHLLQLRLQHELGSR